MTKQALEDCNRNLGTGVASLETISGDAWAANAERQRTGGAGGHPPPTGGHPTRHIGEPQYLAPRSEQEGGRPVAPDAGAAHRFLDVKVAQATPFKYNGKDTPAWVLKVRNYIIGV